ncbi:hypothetical protein AB3S75_016088 [Citrus x aurantiifolia]
MNKIDATKFTEIDEAAAVAPSPTESEQRRSTTTQSRDAVATAFSLNAAIDPQLRQQHHTKLRCSSNFFSQRSNSSNFLSQHSSPFCLKNCDGERAVMVNCG